MAFDDNIGTSNCKYLDHFLIIRRHNKFDTHYQSQTYFDSPGRTIPNNSNEILLLNQTVKDNEIIYRDVCGYDLSYDELKEICRKSWEDEYNYLCIDRSKKRDQGR